MRVIAWPEASYARWPRYALAVSAGDRLSVNDRPHFDADLRFTPIPTFILERQFGSNVKASKRLKAGLQLLELLAYSRSLTRAGHLIGFTGRPAMQPTVDQAVLAELPSAAKGQATCAICLSRRWQCEVAALRAVMRVLSRLEGLNFQSTNVVQRIELTPLVADGDREFAGRRGRLRDARCRKPAFRAGRA